MAYDNEYRGGENPPQIIHAPDDWENDLFHNIVYVDFNSNIKDSDLERLSDLKHLQYLRLSGNDITDAGMACIDKLRSLKFLLLGSGITDQGLAQLRDLHELQSLNLAACDKISGSGLAALTCDRTLRILSLGQGVQDQYLKNVQRFTRLEKLWIGGATEAPIVTDRGIQSLSGHPSLKTLILLDAPITDGVASTISSLPKLETLWIMGSKITGGFSLSGCQKLKRLVLARNGEVGEQLLNGIDSLTNLEVLSLSHVPVTEATFSILEKLPHLRVLSLAHCPVDDTMVDRIAELKPLKDIDIHNTLISDDGKNRLKRLRPDLHIGSSDEEYEF